MAGKGPEWRKGANLKKYYENINDIDLTKKDSAIKPKRVIIKKGKTTYVY